jgi:hypothetical protein
MDSASGFEWPQIDSLAPQECRSNWTISRIHSSAANNLKNSFLCCKQSQEFILMLQTISRIHALCCKTISRIHSYAANNLKNSFLCCKQSRDFFLSFLLVLQNNLKISFLLACAANNLLCADHSGGLLWCVWAASMSPW